MVLSCLHSDSFTNVSNSCSNFPFYGFSNLPLFHSSTTLDPFICPLMKVDKGAITFVLSGANIMCPGLTSKGGIMTPNLPVNSVVTIIAEGKEHALAVGLLTKTPEEM